MKGHKNPHKVLAVEVKRKDHTQGLWTKLKWEVREMEKLRIASELLSKDFWVL